MLPTHWVASGSPRPPASSPQPPAPSAIPHPRPSGKSAPKPLGSLCRPSPDPPQTSFKLIRGKRLLATACDIGRDQKHVVRALLLTAGVEAAGNPCDSKPIPREHSDLMSHQLVIDLTRDAILTALAVAAPMLLIALGVGLVVSIFQSVTQIQEQTLAFVPKLVLVGGAFVVGLPWLIQILVRYTKQLIMSIPSVVS